MQALRGTPLSAGEVLDFAGDLFKVLPRDLSPESVRYWKSHREEWARLVREVMLKPGTRIIDIVRTADIAKSECFGWEGATLERHDSRAKALTELDLSKLRVVNLERHYDEIFGINPKFIPLDTHAAMTLMKRQELIPDAWHKLRTRYGHEPWIRFDGAFYRNPDKPPAGSGYVYRGYAVPALYRGRHDEEWRLTSQTGYLEDTGLPNLRNGELTVVYEL